MAFIFLGKSTSVPTLANLIQLTLDITCDKSYINRQS